jgi:hypothetical protein
MDYLTEYELDPSLFGEFEPQSTVRPSMERAFEGIGQVYLIHQAIKGGNRNENYLTDIGFYRRHPERNGRRITVNEPNFNSLRDEWLALRDQLVRPMLQKLK